MSSSISKTLLQIMEAEYNDDKPSVAMRHALQKTDIQQAAGVQEAMGGLQSYFSIDIRTLPATNQQRTGRCWIFSALNMLREKTAKDLKLDRFEFSQNYTAFWDKLEKSNFFLESVLELRDRPWDDRTLSWINSQGIGDGGQWDMFTAITKKYGLVPKDAMPETYASSNTRTLTSLMNRRLRRFAADIKEVNDKTEQKAMKERCLSEIYGMLCTSFGVPPKTFDFEYVDKDNQYHCVRDLTPSSFYEQFVGINLDDYVSLIHSPRVETPYYRLYTVKYLGNVKGTPVRYLNVPLDELKKAVLCQLKDNTVVWFGCDCGKFGNRQEGYWAPEAFDFEAVFEVDFSISKEKALHTGESAMNHAMLFTGVNLVDGVPTKWKIENSWGDKIAREGYFVGSDVWFDRYVYQAVVDKKYLSDEALAILDEKLIELEPWDPMGTLA
ncbi:MAG: C1 family peptidase [Clostridiaceae bacterium]|nr:C1 family peptidase [Clostridiaceae bacterium]